MCFNILCKKYKYIHAEWCGHHTTSIKYFYEIIFTVFLKSLSCIPHLHTKGSRNKNVFFKWSGIKKQGGGGKGRPIKKYFFIKVKISISFKRWEKHNNIERNLFWIYYNNNIKITSSKANFFCQNQLISGHLVHLKKILNRKLRGALSSKGGSRPLWCGHYDENFFLRLP